MLTVYTMTGEALRSRDELAEALIERMSRGDVSAMGELYELIEKDVYAYALSKTANTADAEDAAHDTFVQLWKHATQYKPMGKPLAFTVIISYSIVKLRDEKADHSQKGRLFLSVFFRIRSINTQEKTNCIDIFAILHHSKF